MALLGFSQQRYIRRRIPPEGVAWFKSAKVSEWVTYRWSEGKWVTRLLGAGKNESCD
jgi:hypothetical protein